MHMSVIIYVFFNFLLASLLFVLLSWVFVCVHGDVLFLKSCVYISSASAFIVVQDCCVLHGARCMWNNLVDDISFVRFHSTFWRGKIKHWSSSREGTFCSRNHPSQRPFFWFHTCRICSRCFFIGLFFVLVLLLLTKHHDTFCECAFVCVTLTFRIV